MRRLPSLFFLCLLSLGGLAHAADVNLLGLFPGKALLVVNGGAPKVYAVGDKVAEGIQLAEVTATSATVDDAGKREVLTLGQYVGRDGGGQGRAVLAADSRGHFVADGQINGVGARMMVDTGATLVILSARDADRLGISYKDGRREISRTANGNVVIYRVRIDTLRVGGIEVYQVDAAVQETGLPFILLGNSFLNRCEMRRDSQQMILTARL